MIADQLHERQLVENALAATRHAARRLLRDRWFTAFVIFTLAIGIGLNATMYGVIDRLLLRGPAGIRASHDVVRLYHTEVMRDGYISTSSAFDYAAYQSAFSGARSVSGVAAYANRTGTLGRGASARQVSIGYVTPNFFRVLGARLAIGRDFAADTAANDAMPPLVLGYGLWQREFGGATDVLGRSVRVADREYTVVGVAAPGFSGAELTTVDAWLPIAAIGARLSPDWRTEWDEQWTFVVARLDPGVSRAAASSELTARFQRAYAGIDPPTSKAHVSAGSLTLNGGGRWSEEAFVSLCLVALCLALLVIACANVANLVLARAVRGQREIAVRIALGASRGQVMQLFLAEAALLAIASTAAALVVEYAATVVLQRRLMPDIDWTGAAFDSKIIIVAVGAAAIVALILGVLPSLHVLRTDLSRTLKAGEDKGSGRTGSVRTTIALSQSALSLVLLVVAGVFIRSLANARGIDHGIDPAAFLVASVEWPRSLELGDTTALGRESARRRALLDDVLRAVRALPGIRSAALTLGLPFRGGSRSSVRVPGGRTLERSSAPLAYAVSNDYFATVGTRVERGRAFTAADRAGGQRVVIVSDLLAHTLWPNRDPIGQCLLVRADTLPCARVVGVAETTRNLRGTARPQLYVPIDQSIENAPPMLVVRPRRALAPTTAAIRRMLLRADPNIDYVDVRTLQQFIDPSERPWRLGALMFSVLAVVAAAVAGIGLFSVVGYLVAQRRREIGIRLALGAGAANVLVLMTSAGVRVALIGEAIGVVLVLAFGRLLDPLLFKTSSRDPLVLGAAVIAMLLVAVIGSLGSAARATYIQPVEALRGD